MPGTKHSLGLGETLDNQRIMKLVEEALQRPEAEREQFLKQQCANKPADFEQALHYVEWEQKMQGFLLDPVIKRDDGELQIAEGDLLQERFRIVREVAQGGMGVVYEARDEKLGRRIALKCAKAGFGNELPPEVRHATEVSHPNVCKIYEIHTTRVKQQLVDFITMEFLEGETLSSRLQGGRIPQEQAIPIARQLAAGLAEAHRNGVIHGDIKSHNIILTKWNDGSLRAVITDFGLSRDLGSASRGVWGTPGYMAPELWMGEQPSVASDIYALGIVIYEMAAGTMPDRERTSQANSKTLKATPWLDVARHKPPAVNAYWDRILGRCLDPDPIKRYKSADELGAALEPGHVRRNALLAVAAALALALTGVITYKSATAPSETIKLAVMPSGALGEDATREIARLTGTKKAGFTLLPAGQEAQATHLLRVSAVKQGDKTTVHAVLSDVQTQAPIKTWDADYSTALWKFAPQALAGLASEGLHLTTLAEPFNMNQRARDFYAPGIAALRQEATIDESLRDIENATAAEWDSPLVWAGLAQARYEKYYSTKDKKWLTSAKEAEEQAELRYGDTSVGHRAAADIGVAEHRLEDAESHLLRAVELEPENPENYRRLGDVYKKMEKFDLALRELRKAVDLEPNYYKNQLRLGILYLDLARYREAVEHLSEAAKLNPTLPLTRSNLAIAYTDTGQFDKALENLRMLKQWGPYENYQMGTILMYQRKDREALPYLQKAVEESPDEKVFFTQLGIAQRRTGDIAESKKTMHRGFAIADQTLAKNPNDAEARVFLGYYCAQLGQRDRALSETAQALRIAPRDQNVIWVAVGTYETLGQREDSLALLRAAAPKEMLSDLKRWPDMADFTADSRFIELTAQNAEKKEK